MAFSSANLNDDEQLVLDIRPHWWFFVPQLAALAGAAALGVVALMFTDNRFVLLAMAALIVGVLGWIGVRYIIWTSTNFVITSDRLINRSGVLRRQGIEIPLERVNTVFFKQTIFERIIGSGDLVIESAGEQGSQMVSDIPRPLFVQNEIYKQMEANENRKFDRVGRNLPAGGSGGGASIPDQIEKLAELYQQGILTEREFESKKKELLDRL